MNNIKFVTFDTGGTILDWHGAIHDAFAAAGAAHGLERDWHCVTNDYRRASMQAIVGTHNGSLTMDDVHANELDRLIAAHRLERFSAESRYAILATWHALPAWPDVAAALRAIRRRLPVVSFTMLPVRLVVDVSRRNGLDWDAILSCEMLGAYKPRLEAYQRVARLLAVPPSQILMVACHNFDLDAARQCAYRTAFVRRPQEWGPDAPPDPLPGPGCDLVVDDFAALASALAGMADGASRV